MSDLEKFLQQAAERMKERMREQQPGKLQQGKKQSNKPPRQQSIRQVERSAPPSDDLDVPEAELVEPTTPPRTRSQRSENFSNIKKRKPPVSKNVDMADERMSERMHQVFDHNLGQLSQKKMVAANDASAVSGLELTNQSSEVDRREQVTSPLIEVLQQPENLKAAFIVGEIFRRKF